MTGASLAVESSIAPAHIVRQPPEVVFDAWLDVRLAARFLFSTDTGEMVRCDIDPRVGGRFVMTDRRTDGDVEHTGEYLVIDRPRQLVFTFGIPAASPSFDIVTLDFTAACWIEVMADGKRVLAQEMAQGESLPVEAQRSVVLVTVGDASAAEVQVNGLPFPLNGKPGEVMHDVVIDLDTVRQLQAKKEAP